MAKLQLTDLTPGKSYKVQIQAYNKETGAESNWSQDYIFTSPEDLTTKLTNFYKTQLGSGGSIFAGIPTGGTPTWKDVNLGFYVDADGYLSLKDRLYFDPTYNSNQGLLTVVGSITASSGTIGGFTIGSSSLYAGSGSNFVGIVPASFPFFAGATDNIGTGAKFSVTPAGALTATNANITGVITATSGSFTGDVNITNPGRLIAGTLGGNSVVISSLGITGVGASQIPTFYLPTDGSDPIIGSFKVVNTGLITPDSQTKTISGASGQTTITVNSNTGLYIGMSASGTGIGSNAIITGISGTTISLSVANSGSVSGTGTFTPNSNLIVGTITNNITVRGQTAGSVLPAIYTTISGTSTTDSANNGFYLGQDGKFRFAQGTNVISGSGGSLSVTGTINATGGNFTSIVTIGNGATTGTLQVGSTPSTAINILGSNTAATAKIYSGTNSTYNNTGNTGFYIDASGQFSIGTTTGNAGLAWNGSSLTIKGNLTSTSGKIGGFDIGDTTLSAINSSIYIKAPTAQVLTKNVTTQSGSPIVTVTSGGTSDLNLGDLAIIFGVDVFDAGSYIINIDSINNKYTMNRNAKISSSNTAYIYPKLIRSLDSTPGIYNDEAFAVWSNGTVMLNDIVDRPGGIGINIFSTTGTTILGKFKFGAFTVSGTTSGTLTSSGGISLTTASGLDLTLTATGSGRTIFSANGGDVLFNGTSNTTTMNHIFNTYGTTILGYVSSSGHGLSVSGTTQRIYMPATTNATTTTTAANMYIGGTGTSPDGLITKSTNSSRRYKNSISSILDTDPNNILDIDVVQFKFNNDYLSENDPNYDKFVIGFIAEDVFEKYPLAADLNDDGTAENWNPRFLIPAMLKVIQNLEKRIAILENK